MAPGGPAAVRAKVEKWLERVEALSDVLEEEVVVYAHGEIWQ